MDPDIIWLLSVAAAIGSLGMHYLSGRFLSGRLVGHLAASHEDGWRACGGSQPGDCNRNGISHYAAWRWLHAHSPRQTDCTGCERLERSGRWLATSAVSTTFLCLAIAQIWGS